MFCPECGTQCGDEQRFCNNCGAQLGNVAEAVPEAFEEVREDSPVTEDAATETPAVEAPAADAPVFAAPVAEQPPVQEQQPVFQPPVQPAEHEFAPPPPGFMPPPPLKKCGVGKWIARIVISCLPLLVTYLALFISGVIWPNRMLPTVQPTYTSGYAPEAKTIATAILIAIGVSALIQIICLVVWALRKKGDPALRDWAVGFIIVALAVAVAALLFSLGMMLFNDSYPRLFSFLEDYVAPVRYIGLLFSAL